LSATTPAATTPATTPAATTPAATTPATTPAATPASTTPAPTDAEKVKKAIRRAQKAANAIGGVIVKKEHEIAAHDLPVDVGPYHIPSTQTRVVKIMPDHSYNAGIYDNVDTPKGLVTDKRYLKEVEKKIPKIQEKIAKIHEKVEEISESPLVPTTGSFL